MGSHVDITGRASEYWKEKVRKGSGVFLCGSRGQRGDLSRGLYGKFAGILQVEIRQQVSKVRMLMIMIWCGKHLVTLVACPMAQLAGSATPHALPRTP